MDYRPISLKFREKLICNLVINSTGQGYDPGSGEFTVPVSGLYTFMVTTRCYDDDVGNSCGLYLMLDDDAIGYLDAWGKFSASTHAHIHARAGQKVFLTSRGVYKFNGGWGTLFSGALMIPDMNT